MFYTPSPEDGKPRVWSVGALSRAIADALQSRFGLVTVRGELSGWMQASSGHCYFTLKDAQGQVRCAMFKRAAQSSRVHGRDGLQVQVQGRLDVYGPRGDLQLIVESMSAVGQGSLYERFLQNKAALEAAGYFAPVHKRALAPYPKGVAVVTSLQAAALRDVLTTLQRRAPHVAVYLFPTPVQGDEAPPLIAKALRSAYADWAQHRRFETLLLVRGGGSLEDLWAFNAPDVALAMAESPVPIVTGVGHETDVTLVDFAADVRAATPTAAAELCAPSLVSQLDDLQAHARKMQAAMGWALMTQQQRMDRLQMRLGRPSQRLQASSARLQALARRLGNGPSRAVAEQHRRLDRLQTALVSAVQRQRMAQAHRLQSLTLQLRALDPAWALKRGYVWLTDAHGRALTRLDDVSLGQAVWAQLQDGQLEMTVQAKDGHKPA